MQCLLVCFSERCQPCRLLQCDPLQTLAYKCIFYFEYIATMKAWCPQFFGKSNLFCCVSLINHHSTRTRTGRGENTVNLCGFDLCWNLRRLCGVYKPIPKNKTARSDGESWIYSGQCNLLNCCSCPFIIINQRAARPKEQFRELQSYAIAESVISLRKII